MTHNNSWAFVYTGENTGSFNMRFDEQLARGLLVNSGVPTIRLYCWRPWAISLGFNQDLSGIDTERCADEGVDIVRRITGGRAVFHAEELTYSVAMHAEGKSILEIYNGISKALVQGLRLYGVNATFSRSQPDLREHYKNPSSIPCFTASARYEIEWRGKKLVGSAQRRFRDAATGECVVLQHGSILLGPAHRELIRYLRLPDVEVRNALSKELEHKTADLSEIVRKKVETAELAQCICRGFEEEWGIQLIHENRLENQFLPIHV